MVCAAVALAVCGGATPGVLAQAHLSLEAGAHHGRLLPQYDFLRPITTAGLSGVEVAALWPVRRRDHYNALFNEPERGVALLYSTLGGREHLGAEVALTYFFRYYYVRGRRVSLYQRFSIGGTYATRPFDEATNFRNVAIATHLNVHFGSRLGVDCRLAPRWRLRTGLAFDHLSNANSREPNRGLNYVSLFGGVSYALTDSAARRASPTATPPPPRHLTAIAAVYGGRKSSKGFDDRYHETAAVSVEVRRRVRWAWSLSAGADFTYNGAVRPLTEVRNLPYQPRDRFQTGLHVGPVLHYRRWGFGLQTGAYLGFGDAVGGRRVYNRALLEYAPGPRLLARVALRSHLSVLDFAEAGLGYRIGTW